LKLTVVELSTHNLLGQGYSPWYPVYIVGAHPPIFNSKLSGKHENTQFWNSLKTQD